jgi:hypothetical protein
VEYGFANRSVAKGTGPWLPSLGIPRGALVLSTFVIFFA